MPADTNPPRPAIPAPARRHVLRCRACGRTQRHTADELRRLARTQWPECCGESIPIDPAPDPEAVPFAEPLPERRSGRRRLARAGVRAEVRRGPMAMGPNLAAGAVEVSEAGARVRLKVAVPVGEEFQIGLWPPSCLRAIRGPAVVRWCRPTKDGAFVIGVKFRRRLTADDMLLLCEE